MPAADSRPSVTPRLFAFWTGVLDRHLPPTNRKRLRVRDCQRDDARFCREARCK